MLRLGWPETKSAGFGIASGTENKLGAASPSLPADNLIRSSPL